MKYERVLRALRSEAWAILPEKLEQMLAAVEFLAGGGKLTAEELAAVKAGAVPVSDVHAALAAATTPEGRRGSAVAVLPLYGVLSQRVGPLADISGGTSLERFGSAFRSVLADPQVGSIVLDIDSPGGSVFGVTELAAEIARARGQKPVVAVANSMAASAAYWIATAASELVVTPSGVVGSIGVITSHTDESKAEEMQGLKTTVLTAGKFKAEGHPYEPLADEARAAMQAKLDTYYAMFTGDVARYRAVEPARVRGGFGEGRVVTAKAAQAEGMVDRVATLQETIERLATGRARVKAPTRAEDEDQIMADYIAANVRSGDASPVTETVEMRRRRLRHLSR
jgi:capsid assembly protease